MPGQGCVQNQVAADSQIAGKHAAVKLEQSCVQCQDWLAKMLKIWVSTVPGEPDAQVEQREFELLTHSIAFAFQLLKPS